LWGVDAAGALADVAFVSGFVLFVTVFATPLSVAGDVVGDAVPSDGDLLSGAGAGAASVPAPAGFVGEAGG
jgi:hypothetical protein